MLSSLDHNSVMVTVKRILRLNPTDRRGELVGQELDEKDISKPFVLVRAISALFVPVTQDLVEFRKSC
jgi:hypothetical protein